MSTDDLTRRARAEAAKWFEGSATAALMSELADTIDVLLGDDNADVQTANVVAQIRAENKRLADEVDRLRAENGRAYKAGLQDRDAEWDRQQDYYEVSLASQERVLTAERDAARAALGRMTELLTLWARLASQQANLGDVVHDLTRALEGES